MWVMLDRFVSEPAKVEPVSVSVPPPLKVKTEVCESGWVTEDTSVCSSATVGVPVPPVRLL